MRRAATALAVVLALAAAAVVVGPCAWQWWDLRRTWAPTTPLAEQCGDEVPDGAVRTSLTGADGTTLGAAVLVDPAAHVPPTTAVVLRQGASQTICDWLPWAGDLATGAGVRVLLFDRRGRGSSPAEPGLVHEADDLARAVAALRADGVSEVVLVASSMGSSVMYASLPLLASPPCAVVSVSPVLTARDSSGGVDGTWPDPLPDAVWLAWEGRNDGIVAGAAHLAEAARRQGRRVHELEVDTDDHSRQLLANHVEVAGLVERAVASCVDG